LLLGLLIVFLFVAAAFGIFLIKLLSRTEDPARMKRYQASLGMKIPIVVLLIAVFALGVFFPQQLTDLLNTIVSELGIR
jgi:hydrogenase-4 component F